MRPLWFLARSIPGLTLAGLLLVALPVAGLLMSAVIRVDRITQAANDSVVRANKAVELSTVIADELVDMERAAGQFAVIGDERLRRSFMGHRTDLLDAIERLRSLELGDEQNRDAAWIADHERPLFELLGNRSSQGPVAQWEDLAAVAERLVSRSRQELAVAFDSSNRAAVDLRSHLMWQASTALPLTLLLVAFAAFMITRPLSDIDAAIRRLANDEFEVPIAVKGPSDVRRLGEALDALRLRIRALEKQKTSFVRRVSHELKTPLTAIRQGAELLADRRGTSLEQTVEIADLLRESSLELQKLIEDLLDYGRTQQPLPQSVVIQAVELKRIVERVLADRAIAVSAKNVRVETQIGYATVSGDVKQLRAVVNNLIDNAIKFTPAGGIISVALAARDGAAILDVADSGPGIPRQDHHKVFEPFYQGPVQPAGSVKGTGLGLAIAKDNITAHDGQIEILDSSTGAHFRVRLPLLQSRA